MDKLAICPKCYQNADEAEELSNDEYQCFYCGHIFSWILAVDAAYDYADAMRDWEADARMEEML